jgi:Predicted periplasmic protein
VAGDCEDYAIAKFIALRRAGLAPDDVRIVVLRDTIHGEDHAVAAARLDGRWLMLDNRRMAMVEDADVRNFRPTFVIGQHGVMRYADAALLADAAGNNPVASLVVSSLAASADRPSGTPTDERRRAIVAQRRPTTICFPCLIFPHLTTMVRCSRNADRIPKT